MGRGRIVRLAVISLGCPKNLVDTERALGEILTEHVALVDDPAEADWVLINTCGFISDAKEESKDAIRQAASLKQQNPSLKIAVAGCLSQRYGDRLRAELGGIDFLTGILTRENARRIARKLGAAPPCVAYGEDDDRQRLRLTPRHTAYLRIAEGCDNRCAYCAIPAIRGPLCSRPFERVLADARELLSDGAVELNVIAQDTTAYGIDLYGKYRLAELLYELRRLNPRGWVRLLYAHPAHLADDVIDALGSGFPFVPYIDLPLQHVNDRVLSAMGRKVTHAGIESLIGRIRARVPGAYIRTAFIVGYPSETKAEFEELLDFVAHTRFERLGAFSYSREEGTRAGASENQVSRREKERRLDVIMKTQAEIAFAFNQSLVGRGVPGIIDGPSGRDDFPLAGRTYGDAPEVDGTVFIRGTATAGDIVTLEITGVEGYDLLAGVSQ